MPTKKTVRKPIEKLSEKEHIEVIEDSSSEEEGDEEIVIPPPPKLVKEKPKRVRTAKQLANDQRLRDAAVARREAKKVAPVKVAPEQIEKPSQQDPDDKPLTMKQYKALIASQKQEVKPKRKYTKKKVEIVTPTAEPTPPPTPVAATQKPNMMFV